MKALFYSKSPTGELFRIMEADIDTSLPDVFFPLPDIVGLRGMTPEQLAVTSTIPVARQAHFVRYKTYTDEVMYLLKEEY